MYWSSVGSLSLMPELCSALSPGRFTSKQMAVVRFGRGVVIFFQFY